MQKNKLQLLCVLSLLGATAGAQQTIFNGSPTRVLGQPFPSVATVNPNLIEGRELASPQGVALDTTSSPPILYVADSANNRVLVWRDATAGGSGAKADRAIGQKDLFSTVTLGSGASSGLVSPTGLLVDAQGNLWVADSGSNRILRYPKPLNQTDEYVIPDLVIGQKDFTSRAANQGLAAPNETTLNLISGTTAFRTNMAFDPSGNLWVTDPNNNRVLRFPANRIGAGAANGPAADVVFGQQNFVSRTALTVSAANRTRKDAMNLPAGIAVDSQSRVYVSDRLGRVLVWVSPYSSGSAAARIAGISTVQGSTVNSISIGITPAGTIGTGDAAAEGLAIVNGTLTVVDTAAHRVMRFPAFDQWPAELTQYSPNADVEVGQPTFSAGTANAGNKEPVANGFNFPVAVAGSGTGDDIYVADARNNRVLRLSGKPGYLNALQAFGQPSFTAGNPNLVEGREFFLLDVFGRISGINASFALGGGMATDGIKLYVADTMNHRVLCFKDIRAVKNGAAADLVIGQTDFFRTIVNSPNGDSAVLGDSGLNLPASVAVDAAGNLWVTDSGNARVLRFPSPFAQPAGIIKANLVLGQANFTGKFTDPTSRTMSRPFGIAFTVDGSAVVSDAAHNRVLLFRKPSGGDFANGQAAEKVFGQPDFSSTAVSDLPQRMLVPSGVAVDGADRLYVADTGRARVAIFDITSAGQDPSPSFSISAGTTANSGLNSPHGVWVSAVTGEIWVADTINNRVLRYPRYDFLLQNPLADFTAQERYPLSMVLDQYGNLAVAGGSNRVAFFYPGLVVRQAANFYLPSLRALAPNTYASLGAYGPPFSEQTAQFDTIPMNKTLLDTQVLMDDNPLPLHFVSPQQINFYIPNSAKTSGTSELLVVRASTGQVLASGTIPLTNVAPGLFTKDSSGNGQIAAVNQDGTINSSTNPAAQGSYISLYGTGIGTISGSPPDGVPPTTLTPVNYATQVFIGTAFVPQENIEFSGLAGCCVGLWQINVKIPDNTAPSNTVLVQVQLNGVPNYIVSTGQRTTIAVKQK